jgi:hypothetical protein
MGSETATQLVIHPKADGNGGAARFHPHTLLFHRPNIQSDPGSTEFRSCPATVASRINPAPPSSKIVASCIQLARGTRLVRSTHPCESVDRCPEIPDRRTTSLLLGLVSPRFVTSVPFCSTLNLHRPWQAFCTLRPNSIREVPCHPSLTTASSPMPAPGRRPLSASPRFQRSARSSTSSPERERPH